MAHDLDRLLRRLAGGQHGLVTRDQLRAHGVSRQAVAYRLGSPDWEALTARVLRLVGHPATDDQRALAAVLDAGGGAVVSHRSAAAVWGLAGFDLGPVHVSRSRRGTDRRTTLATVHHPLVLPRHHTTVRREVPVTTLARTVVDLAGSERRARAELALNAALRAGMAWAALESVAHELGGAGRAGAGVIRELLAAHRGDRPLGSGLEARLLRILRHAGLPEPRRQVDLGDDGWVGRVDYHYDDELLVLEVNGSHWHETPLDVRRDQRRIAALVAAGYRVLPLSEDLIRRSPAEVVRLVTAARRRRTGTCR